MTGLTVLKLTKDPIGGIAHGLDTFMEPLNPGMDGFFTRIWVGFLPKERKLREFGYGVKQEIGFGHLRRFFQLHFQIPKNHGLICLSAMQVAKVFTSSANGDSFNNFAEKRFSNLGAEDRGEDTGIVPGLVIFITTAKPIYYITKILVKCIIFRRW